MESRATVATRERGEAASPSGGVSYAVTEGPPMTNEPKRQPPPPPPPETDPGKEIKESGWPLRDPRPKEKK